MYNGLSSSGLNSCVFGLVLSKRKEEEEEEEATKEAEEKAVKEAMARAKEEEADTHTHTGHWREKGGRASASHNAAWSLNEA